MISFLGHLTGFEGDIVNAKAVAFRQERMNGQDPPFFLITTQLDLVGDIDALVVAVRDQLASESIEACSAIVIDTLNRSLAGSETKDEDMTAYISAVDRLREEFRGTVMIIHHCGVDHTRPRGHTSLTGAIDAQISVAKKTDGMFLVTLELMKDGPEGEELQFKLKPVEVGIDDRGRPITSCVVEYLGTQTTEQRMQPRRLTAKQKRALDMLTEAINKDGTTPPACDHIPANTSCVNEDLWRRYSYEGGISTGKSPNAQRMAFERASDTLIGDGFVGAWGGWVWVIKK